MCDRKETEIPKQKHLLLDDMERAKCIRIMEYLKADTDLAEKVGRMRGFVEPGVDLLAHAMKKTGTGIALSMEAYSGPTGIKGLIAYIEGADDEAGHTIVLPLVLSPGLMWLNGRPFYLNHDSAAVVFVDAMLSELESTLKNTARANNVTDYID